MRQLAIIIAATLAVAACSRPNDDNNIVQIDDDLGGDVLADMAIELPLLEGELIAAPTRDEVEDVRITDGGEFLFIVQDDRWFAWLAKEQALAIEFGQWPDPTRPDDGPPSQDIAFDDTYFWFLSEYDGGWNLAGVEHFLGNPTPLFGQPIIIIDLGPIQKPRGIERYGERFVIPTDMLISVGEDLPLETIAAIGGTPVFDRFDEGWLLTSTGDELELSTFEPSTDTLRPHWSSTGEPPVAFAGEGLQAYFIRNNGELWQELQGVRVSSASPREDPLLAVSGSVVAWTSTDGIRVYDGELRRIDAAEVDAIVVDDEHVWWSSSEGIFRAAID